MMHHAAAHVVSTLVDHGIRRVYCVPGESYLPLLDSLFDAGQIDVITCRHEGGAALMAVAETKLTQEPAVCLVSRGPGATNAAIGVHLAEQDNAPLVLIVGDVRSTERGRCAFQEVDYATALGGLAKWTYVVTGPQQLAEATARALAVARRAPQGPVVLVVPEDYFEAPAEAPATAAPTTVSLGISKDDVHTVLAAIRAAERPLIVAGSRLRSDAGRSALLRAATIHSLPVLTTFKQQDLLANSDPHYAGHLGFKMPPAELAPYFDADLVIAVGTRLGDVSSQGYTFPDTTRRRQRLIHITNDPIAIGRVIRADIGLAADPVAFLEALAGAAGGNIGTARQDWIDHLHKHAEPRPWAAPGDGVLEVGAVVNELAQRLDPDAIITMDSGNFSGWVHRHFPFRKDQRLVGSIGGAMGLAVPGAVAASLAFPHRQVVALVGDGGFMMTGAEIATAIAQGASPKIIVCNNGCYGTIRMHQERAFPGRVVGTGLVNPDFAVMARAYGAFGAMVSSLREIPDAIEAMLAHKGPAVIDLITDAERIAPNVTITQLRSAA
ncbi:MAG: hypothetical protein KGR68_01390 [Betaproteobacteria bacterium]|nr:hypothetical protein [Betaproteobacteria bacterium]